MGRRKTFVPPLLPNRQPKSSLKCLSETAARRREELVNIVKEGEIGSSAPPMGLFSGPAPSSSGSPSLPTAVLVPTVHTRAIQGLLNSQGGQTSKKRKSPHVIRPLFISPRIKSSSAQHRTSPLASTTEISNHGQRVEAEQDSQQGEQMSRIRKSPHVTMPLFISPLSRVMLSPRTRSPSLQHGTSPLPSTTNPSNPSQRALLNIDLNDEVVQGNAHRHQEVSSEKGRLIFDSLLGMAKKGDLVGHETAEVAALYSVSVRTVQRIWRRGKACLDQGRPVDVSNRKKNRCGRKKQECDVSALSSVPISERATMGDAARHLHISITKFHRMKKAGEIKRVSNTLKPFLTDENKNARLSWCLRMLDATSIPHDPMFQGLFDYVYIDEKWFNITKSTLRYYGPPGEHHPLRTSKHKNHIPRVMFLTAIARPRFDSNGNCTFDGKIGCFPLVKYVAAQRSSVNRPAGTIEMKPIDSVDKDVMREFMIEKVIPAIHDKWPREDLGKIIYIQQDNAKPHISPSDRLFCEAAQQGGFDIRIICQPANSPDMNILDLGFFNAIQSLQHKSACRTTQELVAAVDKAFKDYPVCQANRIFLTLHSCLREIMRIGGANGYDIPHIRKLMLERQGCLPLQLKCDATLVNEVMAQVSGGRE